MNKNRSPVGTIPVALLALFWLIFISTAGHAATRTWSGLGANDNWATGGNWVGGVAPSPGDDLVFPAGAARLSNTNNYAAGTAFSSIMFSASGYNLNGANILLAAGISANHTSGVNLVRLPIQLTASQVFANSAAGVLSISGNQTFNLNGHNATFDVDGGEIQMGHSMIGSGTVLKTGPAQLLWGNIGFYTAITEVHEGPLVLANVNALGSTSGGTIVFTNGTLRIDGGTFSITNAEPLTLAGKLLSGGTPNGSNLNVWSGVIVLTGSSATIEVGGKPLMVNSVISGTGSLTKFNSATLTLNANNTYTGNTTNLSGDLLINGIQPQSPVILFGGTLGGNGIVGHVTSVDGVSKIINPGINGPGMLTCSNLALSPSTTFSATLNSTMVNIGYDHLRARGTIALSNAPLNVVLGFVPPMGQVFTLIDNDGVDAVVGTFNGLPEGSIFSVGTNQFSISYAGGTGNDIIITRVNILATGATRIWTGAGGDNFWTTAGNWSNNIAAGPGDDLVFPAGANRLINSNNFPAGTIFNSITFSGGNYFLHGSNLVLNAGINATNTTVQNSLGLRITLNVSQTFTSGNNFVNLRFFEPIDTNGKILTFAGNGFIQLSGVVSGSGGLIKTGTGAASLYATNTFTGAVQVLQGTLGIYNNHALGSTNGNTTVAEGAMLALANPLVVPEPLVLEGALGNLSGHLMILNGPILLNGTNVTIDSLLTLNGIISGNYGFTKNGFDFAVLNGDNTYTGPTVVAQGALFVNGAQPASPILLSTPFSGFPNLAGTGTVGTVTINGSGGLNPGNFGPGILNSSNLTLSSSTFFNPELNDVAPGTGYDQVNVTGTVILSDAHMNLFVGFTPAPGSAFTIINNDGAEPVIGTFNNLPEGTTFTNSGGTFRISYVGGTGNDVVVTRASAPIGFASISRLGNGTIQLQGTGGVSSSSYAIEAATNLGAAIQWSNIGSAIADPSGVFSFTDTNAPLLPARFYRARTP